MNDANQTEKEIPEIFDSFERKRHFGIWIIILIFLGLALFSFFYGFTAVFSPWSIIDIYFYSGIVWQLNANPFLNTIFGITIFTGEPLMTALPVIGVLCLALSFLLIAVIFGLLTYKEWGWMLSAIISIVLIFLLVGIFMTWILDSEKVKIAYGQV